VPRVAAGADDIVDRQRQRPGERDELSGVAVHELLDAHACRLGGQHVLQRIVVRAGLEPDLVALPAAMAGEDVGLHEFQREAQMGPGVDIGNRRGDVGMRCGHRNLQVNWGSDRGHESRPRSRASETIIRAASAAP
jgi:hypothetical protein